MRIRIRLEFSPGEGWYETIPYATDDLAKIREYWEKYADEHNLNLTEFQVLDTTQSLPFGV